MNTSEESVHFGSPIAVHILYFMLKSVGNKGWSNDERIDKEMDNFFTGDIVRN